MTHQARPVGRRTLLAAGLAASLPLPAIAQDLRARTLRFVPAANLSILDPSITTAGVSAIHGFAMFDTLYGLDSRNQPRRQMIDSETLSDNGLTWTFRLRDGLQFHDGEPVRGRDCIASIRRWSARDGFGQAVASYFVDMTSADDRTFRIRLRRPVGGLLNAFAKASVTSLFVLPERLASTDAFKPITEMTGSGPYRFVASEFMSGSRVVYERNAAYVPRDEPPDLTAGGKKVYFDRLEWSIIPDAATAGAALQRGEVDWWEYALMDLLPQIEKNRDLVVQNMSSLGLGSVLRFNFLQPPFNNPELRRIVRDAVDQADYMRAIHGEVSGWSECHSMFTCGVPGVIEQSVSPRKPDALRAAVKAAGYGGEKVVILNPTDYSFIASQGLITGELLTKLGFNVEVAEMDFGTLLRRRLSKEPVDKGGWSIFHTSGGAFTLANPADNYCTRGPAEAGWPGWYVSAEAERLTFEWLEAVTPEARQTAFEAAQRLAYNDVPIVPLGFWRPKNALRKNLSGVIDSSISLFWNVRRL